MVKQDLSFGNVVELRSGDLCIYDNTLRFICLRKGKYLRDISSYNPTLRNIEFNGWDIVKVYEDYTLKEVLWEREKEHQRFDFCGGVQNKPRHSDISDGLQ